MRTTTHFSRGLSSASQLRRGVRPRPQTPYFWGRVAVAYAAAKRILERKREAALGEYEKVRTLREAIREGEVRTQAEVHALTVKLWPGMAYARERKSDVA
jgi:hypothetical protein